MTQSIHTLTELAAPVSTSTPWPLDPTMFQKLLKGKKRIIAVENNATGQFARLLRQETGIQVSRTILKYNGSQFYPHEIIEQVKRPRKE